MNARLLALTLIVLAVPYGAEAQADQQALARQILTDDLATSRGAFYQARSALTPEEMGPELRSALITVLERQNRVYRENKEASSADEGLTPFDLRHRPSRFWGEGFADLLETVIAFEDPDAISALADALLGWDGLTRPALARFGERAAPAVLDLAEGGAWYPPQVEGALAVLTLMIEEPTGPPLSPTTLQRANRIARKQLTTGPADSSQDALYRKWRLHEAIPLALALDDPSLREMVQTLARDPAAVRRLGMQDPAVIAHVQSRAARELARRPMR